MSEETTPEDIYTRRALKVLRAAEAEALTFGNGTADVNSLILRDFEKGIEKPGERAAMTRALNMTEIRLNDETKRLEAEMRRAQAYIIRRELAWHATALDHLREGNLDIPANIPVPGSDFWNGYDTETAWYRRQGARLFSKEKPDNPLAAEMAVYYLPKKGAIDFSSNSKLRKKFQNWHMKWLGLDPKTYKRHYSHVFETESGHPIKSSEVSITEFLDTESPGWQATFFEDKGATVAAAGAAAGTTAATVVVAKVAKPGIAKSILYAPPEKIMSDMVERANKITYQGRPFAEHLRQAFTHEYTRVSQLLREGFLGGKTIDQLTRDVKGVIGQTNAQTRTLVRSYYMHNATVAKENVFNLAPDIVEGKYWVSTLDGRTTPLICGVRDGKEYTLDNEPVGHYHTWNGGPGRIHWNCRSTSIPKIKGFKRSITPRASVVAGENYTRGANKTKTGRVRKAWKDAREKGIFKTEMRTTRTQYEGWLRSQSRKNIDYVADVLQSKEKAIAFRNGEVSLADLERQSPVANISINDTFL